LLVFLKAYRNTVPVPRHWCHKRKYLQGKRGIDKAPFQVGNRRGVLSIVVD
jgi:splicing factor 3B subunit 2